MVFYESIIYKKTSFPNENMENFKFVIDNVFAPVLLYRSANIIVKRVNFEILFGQSFQPHDLEIFSRFD